MSTAMRSILRPEQDNRQFLIKWVIALLVPLGVFTVLWGESIVNNVLLGLLAPGSSPYGNFFLIQAAVFVVLFYATVVALVGYLVAADSGRRSTIALWIDVLIFLLI